MRIILRRVIAGALFFGAFITLGCVPLNANWLPAADTYAEEAFLVQMLILAVMCVIAGFLALPRKPS
jgi:hypothetical protein